jgi:hypothetical protein
MHQVVQDVAERLVVKEAFQILCLTFFQSGPPLFLIEPVLAALIEENMPCYISIAEIGRVREVLPHMVLKLMASFCKSPWSAKGSTSAGYTTHHQNRVSPPTNPLHYEVVLSPQLIYGARHYT